MEKYLESRELCCYFVCCGLPEKMEEFKEEFLIRGSCENQEWTQLPNGRLHGILISRFDNKKIISTWKNGERHGETQEYDGEKLVSKTLWKRGKIKQKSKFDEGSVFWTSEYKNGELHGLERTWMRKTLYSETEWVNGKMHGQQKTYDGDGKLFSVSFWVDGVPEKVEII